MIDKTRAIVLHHLKYSETSVILTLYTEHFGRQSYMINGIRSSKSKQKMGLLQPLFLLEIDAYHKTGREIQRLKEFKMCEVYRSIPFDVVKSTMSMFLAEVLFKVLRSEESDSNLFEFIFDSVQYFDSMQEGIANFHLWFLTQFISFLGFKFENNSSEKNIWFNMKSGNYVSFRPSYPNTPDIEESKHIANLIELGADELSSYSISGNQRARLLEILIEYYMLHIEGMGTINSLRILQEIYH